jgi:hypothetical protein
MASTKLREGSAGRVERTKEAAVGAGERPVHGDQPELSFRDRGNFCTGLIYR